MLNNVGQYSKFIVVVLGTVSAALTTFYGTAKWEPVVVFILTALVTYLVPNSPKVLPPVASKVDLPPGTYGTPTSVQVTHTTPNQ